LVEIRQIAAASYLLVPVTTDGSDGRFTNWIAARAVVSVPAGGATVTEQPPFPLPTPQRSYRITAIGAALCAAAAACGAVGDDAPISTIRLVLVAAGCLTAGAGLSLRPGLPPGWLLFALAAGLSILGLPAHWDSVRMVAGVACGVGLAGAVIAALPMNARFALASVAALYHFFGIFLATTWPDPSPNLTGQIGTRTHLPYLMFMYLRNAYHFYSPEPGPASLFAGLIEYEKQNPGGAPEIQREWIQIPGTGEFARDPLGLRYYRRLSITEQASGTMPTPMGYEKQDVWQRRVKAANGDWSNIVRVPMVPNDYEPVASQYRLPQPFLAKYVIPSYARHILKENSKADRPARAVKLYRLEHRVISVAEFADNKDPFHPETYRVFFLGEFVLNDDGSEAVLKDPQDPMLYWLLPVFRRPNVANPKTVEDEIDDYFSKHAGSVYKWGKP
jgi:hypothetical protein